MQVAEQCPRLTGLLQEQQSDAEARVETHWLEVQQKRQELADLREQLRELDASVSDLEARVKDAQVCVCVMHGNNNNNNVCDAW